MRIECEVCSATYTIDDAQLSEQPIGAQCPYCGHVRLVRRGDPPGRAPGGGIPSFATTAHELGFNAPPPFHSPSAGGSDLSLTFGSGAFSGAAGDASGLSAVGAASLSGGIGDPGGTELGGTELGGGVGSSAQVRPPGSVSIPNVGHGAGGAAPDRFAALDGLDLGFGEAASDSAKCQVCGTVLSDEFDKVIGLCDVHQRDRRGASSAGGGGADAGSVRWYVRTRDGRTTPSMALEDLRARIRQGEFSSSDEFSKDGIGFSAMSSFQEIAYLAGLGSGSDGALFAGGARLRAVSQARGTSSLGRRRVWVAAAIVISGAGGLFVIQRHKVQEAVRHVTGGSKAFGEKPANPLKRLLASWSLKHPDASGSAHEHLVRGRARHLEDTWRSYQLAEEAFERALLLDENDATAIAGYVENLAVWRYALSTQDEVRTAQAALKYAFDLSPQNPAVHRASAAMALARGELNGCRSGAEEALARDATDGLAKLLLAGCYLEGNVPVAIQEAERAAKLVPELRRADRVLAVAYAKAGRYASAFRVLDARLRNDPRNSALHVLFGNIARELAQLDIAEKHYRQALDGDGDIQEAHLALGELSIEKGDVATAVSEFKRAAETQIAQPERLARAYAGWARGELIRQRPQEAARLAKIALSFSIRDPEALIVGGEAALAAGSATTAAVFAKRALDARSGEPAALVLAGRAAAAERSKERAIKHLEDAIANDPNDTRLKGILGATYLTMGGAQQAYAIMRKAAEIDPEERHSRSRFGPLALTEGPLREAIEGFRRSASEEANASVASSSMGLLYYHMGDRARAIDAIGRALRIDDSNVTALLYDAQLALDRGDLKRAEASAERILAIERGAALGHLMLARAKARRGDRETALEQYAAALRSNPGLLAARVEHAGLGIKSGDRERALDSLATAFQLNPQSLAARRLLYEAGF